MFWRELPCPVDVPEEATARDDGIDRATVDMVRLEIMLVMLLCIGRADLF